MTIGHVSLLLLHSLSGEDRELAIQAASSISILESQQQFSGIVQELIDLDVSQPERYVFLILKDEDVVGIGSIVTGPIPKELWPPPGRAVQLFGFIVDQSPQRQGFGTAAAHACVELTRAVDSEADYLQLAVNLRNPGARHAHEKAGFVTHQDPYFGGPAGPQYIMYRALT